MIASHEVDLVAIGAGPSNLALAVALEELAPELAARTLLIEQHDDVAWQRGMLLPTAVSQVSFLKDLVTLRNPRSAFSFVNYLHSVGRLDDFINLASFTPYRLEISQYLAWVAGALPRVRVQFGRRCVGIDPAHGHNGAINGWLVRLADGTQIPCRALSLGIGREPNVPRAFKALPRERVIHSTEYAHRVGELDPAGAHRVVVLGSAQSAAEMLWSTHQSFPHASCTMVMRSIGLNTYESSKFTNELYFPAFVDEFYAATPPARAQLLDEMHRTNYGGLAPATLDALYREVYAERLTGRRRLHMITMADVVDARLDGDVVLRLRDRRTGRLSELRCDVVLLGTGFERRMPRLVREIAADIGIDEPKVTRRYQLELPEGSPAACYLQGVNEATHGIGDSLLSLLAIRAGEIATDLVSERSALELVSAAA